MNHLAAMAGFGLAVFLALLASEGDGFESNGARERRLRECPSSPNCVSSQSRDPAHAIDPLRFDGSPDEAFECLKKITRSLKRAAIVSEDKDFLHVKFRTLMGFADDAEFLLDREDRAIHMRSASRVGYWDLGLNRRRLEGIRTVFAKQCGK